MRSQVYAHVQKQPIAFFTRTQTGALITRLNNDILGAQQAFTGTLGNLVSNFIGVITVLDHDAVPVLADHPALAGRAADLHHPGQAARPEAAGR